VRAPRQLVFVRRTLLGIVDGLADGKLQVKT